MKTYLNVFERAVKKQAEQVGEEAARKQAKKAGLRVSKKGHIVRCSGNPQAVLARLLRSFAKEDSSSAVIKPSPPAGEPAGNDDSEKETKIGVNKQENDERFSTASI